MMTSILVVDDDTDTRMMLQIALSLHHFEVTVACNAFEALQAATTRNFDLFVLDYWMPDITGVELCRMLRLRDQQTPIIFLSGAGHDYQAEASFAGADCYLTKPVDLEVLVDSLNKWSIKNHHPFKKG